MSVRAQKIFTGSERTILVKKNIVGSLGIKGLGILTSVILVPLTIHLLDKEKYGIWITIFSIVSWFNMMDIGLGNGFRNKFAEAIALDDKYLARIYVQTLYSSMILIAGAILLFFFTISYFLNWNAILNIPPGFDEDIHVIVAVVFALFCVQLVLKNISTVLLSLQKTTFSNSLVLLGNLLTLLLIGLINKFYEPNLFSIALVFMVAPILVSGLTTVILFGKSLNAFRPAIFRLPQRIYFKALMSLGLKFFIIQITTIVMFSSSSIIITQLYGPAAVTPYNVTYQLFATVQVIFAIIMTPFWSAFTEANAKGDFGWMKNSIKKLVRIWILFSVGIIILWLISPIVFRAWLGNDIVIPRELSFQFALFSILMTWSSIFSYFLAGIGKITISLYGAIFQLLTCIPMAIFLAEGIHLKSTGIILATNINLLVPVIFLSIQTQKILNQKAYGLWNR
ncbi:MAG: hypothetical protein Q7T76_14270 [Ferruginibacter sp.]|nr:hypothetical protein [Ferruginibacter sp.]